MVDKNKMDLLKDEFINAKSEKERESVREKMRQMCDDDAVSVATLAVEQIKETHTEIDAYLIRKQMEDILPCISLAYIAETYFKKSRQWLYMQGICRAEYLPSVYVSDKHRFQCVSP